MQEMAILLLVLGNLIIPPVQLAHTNLMLALLSAKMHPQDISLEKRGLQLRQVALQELTNLVKARRIASLQKLDTTFLELEPRRRPHVSQGLGRI